MDYTVSEHSLSNNRPDVRAQAGRGQSTNARAFICGGEETHDNPMALLQTGNLYRVAAPNVEKEEGSPSAALRAAWVAQGEAPPYGNTGAQPTGSVDWVGFSFPEGTKVEDVTELLGRGGWVEMAKGWLGYKRGYVRGNVRVLYDGMPGMGVHVEASGQGCRELEQVGAVNDWRFFLGEVVDLEGKFSRLDIAFDDQAATVEEGRVKLPEVVKAIEEGTIVSRYRGWKLEQSGSLKDPEEQGTTIYFGSAQSDTRIRMYDKAAQLGLLGEHWVRVELQARDGKAHQMARMIATKGVEVVAGVIQGLLDFKVKNEADSNVWRQETVGWWKSFLGAVQRVRLTIRKAQRTAAEAFAWLERQVAPTIAALVEASKGDLRWVGRLARENRWRMKAHHRALIPVACAIG